MTTAPTATGRAIDEKLTALIDARKAWDAEDALSSPPSTAPRLTALWSALEDAADAHKGSRAPNPLNYALRAELTAQAARIAELEGGLEPFAFAASFATKSDSFDTALIAVLHLRTAARVLGAGE